MNMLPFISNIGFQCDNDRYQFLIIQFIVTSMVMLLLFVNENIDTEFHQFMQH